MTGDGEKEEEKGLKKEEEGLGCRSQARYITGHLAGMFESQWGN